MSYKILIIDDDVEVTSVYKALFKMRGFQVDVANTYKDASDKLSKNRYDVVLLDYILDEYNGLELLEKHQQHINSNTAVIIISSIDDMEVLQEFKRYTNVYFIRKVDVKMFCFSSLIKTLRTLRGVIDDSN
mgnify:FL=1